MINFVKTKKITLALMMLIALTSLITFNACKDDVKPNNPIGEGEGNPPGDLHDLLGDSPACSFRFYTRSNAWTTPVGPFTEEDVDKKGMFQAFDAYPSDGEGHVYRPKYFTVNGVDWPYDGGYSYRVGGDQHDYIEDINVVMEYKGTEFKWSGKNIPEVEFDFHYTDTIEIDRSKPFYVKYSGGNSGARETKLTFGGNRIQAEDNENIAVPPEILQKFPAGIVPIIVALSRHKGPDTEHNGSEVRITIDNIQGSGFIAKFK